MVALQLFLGDKVYGGLVLVEVVGHGLDLVLDASQICAFLRNNEALTGVLVAGGQLGILASANNLNRRLYRAGVLTCILDAPG